MPLLVVAALLAIAFGPTLAAGRLALIGDPLKEFYPLRTVAWRAIRHGHLPLWTPNIFSGYPLSAEVMFGFGYPVTWGYLFLPGQWAEQIYVAAPYVVAPLLTYAFLRDWERSRTASIFGAIAFTYGGFLFSPIGLTGVHANSAMWLPLLFLAITRARRRPLVESLLLGTLAYTLSMLAGSGQIFLYGGALAIAYALFLAAFPEMPAARRWQPVVVVIGAIVLAAGLTAFQSLQTAAAVKESIRHGYPQSRVEEGSLTPTLAWHSLVQPLGNFWDSSPFVPLLALLLAIAAIFGVRRPQVWFWTFVAATGWFLILGKYTPLFALYEKLPFVTLFRYPSRHSLEWTFAIAVLAAYGWDFVESKVTSRAIRQTRVLPVAIGALVMLGAFTANRWVALTIRKGLDQLGDPSTAVMGLDSGYLAWKAVFTLCAITALLLLCLMRDSAARRALVIAVAAAACFVEPYIWIVRPAFGQWSVPRAMFGTFGSATRALLATNPPGTRTFSLPHPYAEYSTPVRDVDPVNWTALAGLEDANGYESLILSRYDRAFRGEIESEPFLTADPTLLSNDSHLFDILNVGSVVAFKPFSPVRPETIDKDGVPFTSMDFGIDVKRERPTTITAAGADVDAVALVTTLGSAAGVEQGTPVARVTLRAADGRSIERDLLAGVHTAELGIDLAATQGPVHHKRAPVFDSWPGDADHTFDNHRYFAKIDLGTTLPVTRVEFLKLVKNAGVGLWKVSLHESRSGQWVALPQPPPERWPTVYDRNGVVVIRNRRVMPRAWLVPNVEMVDWAEMLRRVRGESTVPFDPRTTALIEETDASAAAAARELGAPLAPGDGARVVRREPESISIETTSSQPALLVVSEVDYPGWVARLDGRPVPIHGADCVLRCVFVPRGTHTVTMRYHPPGARRGVAVSLATLLLIGGGVLFDRRRRRDRSN